MSDRLMQVIVFSICVVGYVVLASMKAITAEYVTLIGPVLAVVILQGRLGKQEETLKEQDKVLGKIEENTNGVLTDRIRRAVGQALDERSPD